MSTSSQGDPVPLLESRSIELLQLLPAQLPSHQLPKILGRKRRVQSLIIRKLHLGLFPPGKAERDVGDDGLGGVGVAADVAGHRHDEEGAWV